MLAEVFSKLQVNIRISMSANRLSRLGLNRSDFTTPSPRLKKRDFASI